MLTAIGQGASIALLVYGGLLFLAHQDVLGELPGEKGKVERGKRFARAYLMPVAYCVQERAAAAALAFLFIVAAAVH
jgi:hypothetical protein